MQKCKPSYIRYSYLLSYSFAPVEPALLLLSEYLTPAKLLDIYVPVIGAFSQQLMVLLVSTLGVMNVLSSLIKWYLLFIITRCNKKLFTYSPYWLGLCRQIVRIGGYVNIMAPPRFSNTKAHAKRQPRFPQVIWCRYAQPFI